MIRYSLGLKEGDVYKIESQSENLNHVVGENSKLIFESKDTRATFNIIPLEIIPDQLIKVKTLSNYLGISQNSEIFVY
jgi:hypothetical protein